MTYLHPKVIFQLHIQQKKLNKLIYLSSIRFDG